MPGGVDYSTALGFSALNSNTTGYQNTALGSHTLANNTSGYRNTAVGTHTLYFNTIGNYITAFGTIGLQGISNGLYNTAVGDSALVSLTSGDTNTALGASAGVGITSVSTSTFVGGLATATVNGLTNATAIGYGAQVSQSNSLILGAGANVGIGTSAPAYKLDVAGTGSFQGIRISSGAVNNYVLTSDASGNARWAAASGGGWQLTGNTGTSSGTNYIGTSDNMDVIFKRNNVRAGWLNSILGNTSW